MRRNKYDNLDPIERLARKRAGAKLGWYLHATVFLLVNALLWSLALASGGGHWAAFPTLGWGIGLAVHGIGLAVHGIVVFVLAGGAGLHERMVQAERERIARQAPRP